MAHDRIPIGKFSLITRLTQMALRVLPAGRCLSLIYKGPYSGLHEAWTRIGLALEQGGYQPAGYHGEQVAL